MAEHNRMTLQQALKYIAAGKCTTISSIIKDKHTKGGFFSTLHRGNLQLRTMLSYLVLFGQSKKILDHLMDKDKPTLRMYDVMVNGSFDIKLKSGEVITILKGK